MTVRTCTFCALAIAGFLAFLGCESMYMSSTENVSSGGGFSQTGAVGSSFKAIQVDPRSEDSAGPQLVVAADFDNDGLMDLASAWNQTQPVQVHLQRRNTAGEIAFQTVPVGGTMPITIVADLGTADLDQDGRADLIVLIKDTGVVATCDESREDCDVTDNGGVVDGAIQGGIVVFYGPEDSANDAWEPVLFTTSFLAGRDEGESLTEGSYTGMAIADIDGRYGPDLVVAFNSAEGEPNWNSIDLWANPGSTVARNGDAWTRTMIHYDLPPVANLRVLDVDRDGDEDVVCSYPTAASLNVRWLENPLDAGDVDLVYEMWNGGMASPVGQSGLGADGLEIGDLDNDGLEDVVIRSSAGQVIQWFKRPAFPSDVFLRSPWQVYTLAEFLERTPETLAVGDITGDDQVEVVVAAEGAVAWFDSSQALNAYDQWGEVLIIDDSPADSSSSSSTTVSSNGTSNGVLSTDPQQTGNTAATLVATLLIADIDGDGMNDIVGTLDRTSGSGLTNDALFLFINERNPSNNGG